MMKRSIIFSAILLKGFSAVIAQTLLIRELLIIFYGNELTFGIILGIWLISGAIGSGFIGSLFKTPQARRPYCFFQIASSLWFLIAIVLIRTSRSVLGISFAEIYNLNQIIVITAMALCLLALSDGAMFNLGFRLIKTTACGEESSVAKIYLLESIGVIIGGISFTFILLSLFNSFQIAFVVLGLNCLCCTFLLREEKNAFLKVGSWLLVLASIILWGQSQTLQRWTLAQQWQKKNIIVYKNSLYGNIAVSKELNQYTLFYDGLPAISVPAPEIFFTEDFVHIPLLIKPKSQNILFVGNALGGLLREALKYPLREVIYAELDPLFTEIIRSLEEPTSDQELKDPRLDIRLTDGRSYIKNQRNRFDCIFVNTGLPTSLTINRYYTKEFFQEVKASLKESGMAVFKTWGSLTYLSRELKAINASLWKTLHTVFPYVEVVPGDGFNIFIASEQEPNLNADMMAKNWRDLNLKTSLINPAYLSLRLERPYRDWFDTNIQNEIRSAEINYDLKPTTLYEGLSLYYSQFSKKIPKILAGFKKISPAYFAIGVIVFLGLWRIFLKHHWIKWATLNLAVLSSGFFSMSIQIIVLFLFQSLLGYLFQWLAILTTSFMAGASLGAYYANKKLKTLSEFKKLGWIEIFLSTMSAILILGTIAIFNNTMIQNTASNWLFPLISLSAGLLVGLEIPIVYELYIKMLKSSDVKNQRLAGQLYCLDLLGACLGALLTPLLLIPSCGIIATTLILCLIKIGNGWNIFLLQDKR